MAQMVLTFSVFHTNVHMQQEHCLLGGFHKGGLFWPTPAIVTSLVTDLIKLLHLTLLLLFCFHLIHGANKHFHEALISRLNQTEACNTTLLTETHTGYSTYSTVCTV